MTGQIIPPPNAELRWNLRQLYADVFWFGVLAGSTLAFMAVYAARLDATSFQIGLLSAGPALVNLLFTLPAGRWLERHALLRSTFISSVLQRLGYVLLIGLPWVFMSATGQVWGMVWITLVMSVPGTLLAIAFNSTFAEVVPDEWRGQAVGWRNALVAVSVTLTTLLCGRILDKVVFPVNYQIVFLIGAVGALMSSYHLGRVRKEALTPGPSPSGGGESALAPLLRSGQAPGLSPAGSGEKAPALEERIAALPDAGAGVGSGEAGGALPPSPRAGQAPGPSPTRGGEEIAAGDGGGSGGVAVGGKGRLLRLDLLRGSFGTFMLAYVAFYTFQYFALPIFPLFYVNDLKLTDGMIGLGSAMFHGVMVLCSLWLSRASARFGHRKVLLASASAFVLYPMFMWLGHSAGWYFAACLWGGAVYAFLSGGLINRLMERSPADDRPAHMALHNLALNLGILAGSLLGPAVGEWIGLRDAMLVAVVVRAFAAWMLYRWG